MTVFIKKVFNTTNFCLWAGVHAIDVLVLLLSLYIAMDSVGSNELIVAVLYSMIRYAVFIQIEK